MKIKLSTGKEISANRGIVGLGPGPDFKIGEGYDGTIYSYDEQKQWDEDIEPTDSWVLTKAEQIELADLMIARWQEFKLSRTALREESSK